MSTVLPTVSRYFPTDTKLTPRDVTRIRADFGLSQAEFAAALGVERNTVARWETGTREVPPLLAMALKGLRFTHQGWLCPCPACFARRRKAGELGPVLGR